MEKTTKTVYETSMLDLCRALPDPDAEKNIRLRWNEFGEQLSVALYRQKPMLFPVGPHSHQDDIADAKAAMDELAGRGLSCLAEWDGKIWMATLYDKGAKGIFITVKASTEALARAACSLLVVETMRTAVLGSRSE